jgi:hypothetical protein
VARKPSSKKAAANRYGKILEHIFSANRTAEKTSFPFERAEFVRACSKLKIDPPKNLGDVIYSFRFREGLPESITETAPEGYEWIIRLAGKGRYRFSLVRASRVLPNPMLPEIKIPDATPQIILKHAKGDEQALLAKVRYNRLVDIFLRVTAYSLQSHLRTTVPDLGQIETDEVYVGIRNTGQQFVIPVQAKGGKDQIGIVQVEQDLALCQHAFPELKPRLVAVQFIQDERGEAIVMFETIVQNDELKIADEKHYRLVPASDITQADLDSLAPDS